MTTADKLKSKLMTVNPIACLRRNRMRKSLENKEASFLAPNCIGGILFHDLGLKFQSPTVNLMMLQTDFVRFVCDLDNYVNEKLVFFEHEEYACPCAHLGDIDIHFTHYNNPHEAEFKWQQRCRRINKDNLFIFAEERDGLKKEDILKLGKLKARGIVVFTANQYHDIPYALYLSEYNSAGEVGNILKRFYLDDSRKYERYFDFVKWFNEADGGSYDITPYSRIKEK